MTTSTSSQSGDSAAGGRSAIGRRRYVLAIVLGVIACYLVVGGTQLALIGGTTYYTACGLALGACAWLAATGRNKAIPLYGAILAGTMIWSLAEAGLDPWQLQARLFAPCVLGLWVAWPWVRRQLAAMLSMLALAAAGFAFWLVDVNAVEAPAGTPAASQRIMAAAPSEWPHYGNDLGGSRFAPVDVLTPANVAGLKPAWTYRTGVANSRMGFEATPIMADGTLFLCTPNNVIIALDPETGLSKWRFDPKTHAPPAGTCRGVSYVATGTAGECARRVIFATVDARLMAVDAATGRPCSGFGDNGSVDLKRGLGKVMDGYYYVSSAPLVMRGKIILGGWVLDGQYVGEPSGVVRAYDAATGAFAWAWDIDRPDRHDEPQAPDTYSHGTPNSWGPMSGDAELGLAYVPIGNSTPDYWGAFRSPGSEKYGSSVVALDVETGKARWSFQTVHHDVWDYDVSGQGSLVDMTVGGQKVRALIQPTKRGEVFVLDRRTGTPLTQVEELPVPQRPAKGDWLSPTQPFSTGMPAFERPRLSEAGMWGLTPLDQLSCRIMFKEARFEGPMTPPGTHPTITYPSYMGGINWAGVTIDPERQLMFVNWSRIGNYTRLVPRAEAKGLGISKDGGAHVGQPVPQLGTPFAVETGPFVSPLNVPCTQPPFGKIAAVDLKSRKLLWQRTLGTSAGSGPFNTASHLPLPMGVPNTGGSVSTRSGLLFIAATPDRMLRAFDSHDGRLLWKWQLPAGGHATPMTFVSRRGGRQFVVISAGGSAPLSSGAGDYVMAFALPDKRQ